MIYELVLWNFDCSLEFVFSLLLLQSFNFSPVSFACNFQDWGCVILREIDFLLKICWSIPCLHPSWKEHTCSLRRADLWMHQAVRNIQTTPQTSNAHAEERQYKKLIWSSTWYNCLYCISSVSQDTEKRHKSSKCLVCSQDIAKSSKWSVSYDTCLDVFLFRSATCTKFCCRTL